jgi:hypothetical protein
MLPVRLQWKLASLARLPRKQRARKGKWHEDDGEKSPGQESSIEN